MSHSFNVETVDADGAIRDAAEAAGLDRSDFLKKSVLAGGGLLAGSAMFTGILSSAQAAISTTKKSAGNDVKILNYALTLEYLEAAFYKEAVATAAFGSSAPLKTFAETVLKHEDTHVKFLKGALGSKAGKSPKFDFGELTSPAMFAGSARLLEDTGVSAYLGQVKNVFVPGTLQAAGTIATVEARHAAWIRFIIGEDLPAPASFDKPKSEKAILKAVTGLNVIQ